MQEQGEGEGAIRRLRSKEKTKGQEKDEGAR